MLRDFIRSAIARVEDWVGSVVEAVALPLPLEEVALVVSEDGE